MNPSIFACIEIGSNAVRMIVGEIRGNSELHELERGSVHLRLGDTVFEHGEVSEKVFQQLLNSIQQLLSEVQKYQPAHIKLFATSAMREAKNRIEVINRLKSLIGFPVKILSGKEESGCLAEGIKSFLPPSLVMHSPFEKTVLLDLGGGSLEVSLLAQPENKINNDNDYLNSFDLGTLRLVKMDKKAKQLFANLPEKLSHLSKACSINPKLSSHLILTGGNAKTFARLYPQMPANLKSKKIKTEHFEKWLCINWPEFERLAGIFQKQSPQDLNKHWKLRSQQTEVYKSALSVFLAIGRQLRIDRVSIPLFGLKESLLLSIASDEIEKPVQDLKLILSSELLKQHKIIA
jgi:exopolyphosphatase/guanosine-5'-triphosphate,3'-diphosphate pyrophosphatase